MVPNLGEKANKKFSFTIMFQFDQAHLRVTKPITHNGISPVVDQETGKIKTKVVHLPLAAEKGLLEQNNRLPDGLKIKIEKIPRAEALKK